MKRRWGTFFACLLASGIAWSSETAPPPTLSPLSVKFDGASWIWFTPDAKTPPATFPEGTVHFRTAFVLPEHASVQIAEVAVTADNLYTLHVNGSVAGESSMDPDDWHLPGRFDVTRLLVPGRNVLAVEATNTAPGPAGLIVSLVVRLADGHRVTVNSGGDWKASDTADVDWPRPAFDDAPWPAARVLGGFGMAPWGRIPIPAKVEAPRLTGVGKAAKSTDANLKSPIIFIGDDCSLSRENGHASLSINIFNVRNTRAFPEYDLPLPVKIGRRLFSFSPGSSGAVPKLLLDAGTGAIGSPCVSFDGRFIYLTMAAAGDPFFHIYRLPAEGGKPQRLTSGPFHDIDPAELPDGRIVFASTRHGTYDEYHGAPSRGLFSMDASGGDIRVVTPTFNFDNEPRVLADGRIIFVRTDNFFDRAKVETILHATRPDGTGGQAAFGLDNGPEYGGRLRAFNCGSPAPLADGRVAFVTGNGIVIGRPGEESRDWQHLRLLAADVSALPDGRLLCTLPPTSRSGKPGQRYTRIGIVDPDNGGSRAAIIFDGGGMEVHSPVHLGPRPTPPVLAAGVDRRLADNPRATGVMICQNARITRNTTAGWTHVRAVRVLGGKGNTLRSSHSYLVHSGSEAVELGTVPLAPDGSFAVEVPADMPIAFQLVDAEGRAELNEMSWNSVRPGERRSCVGCHEARQASPAQTTVQAVKAAPVRLQLQNDPHRFRANNAAVTGLMETQFDRFREVASLNRHAASIPELIGWLNSGDAPAAFSAAQRLGLARDPAAAPALAAALGHKTREVRMAAAMALATCGTRESVPPLLAALDDTDPLVAQAAAVALENLTGHAEPAFNPFSRTRQPECWRDWFRSTNWGVIEKELVVRLANPDRAVVRRAAVTLGHTGSSEAARAALRHYLAQEGNNRAYADWRRHHQGDNAQFNDLAPVNPRTVQAVARALGGMRDRDAVPLLAGILRQHANPASGNLFLAEAAAEALGQIGTPEATRELAGVFVGLASFEQFTNWYGDHAALMACHASPIHYFIIKALAAADTAPDAGILPAVIRSVPVDFDRGLFFENDAYETLAGRLLLRNDPAGTVAGTCLALLGDPQAKAEPAIAAALAKTPRCWAGNATPEIRAAQILSLVCHDRASEPRVRAAFLRYQEKTAAIRRVYDKGVPVVEAIPLRHWVCFFLARTLGNLADPRSAEPLAALLAESAPEAAAGRPDPTGNGVLFLHNDLTPCWRAAVAWALGRIGDRHAVPALLKVVRDLDNAPDTRCAAAEALARIADPDSFAAIRDMAASYPETATRNVLLRMEKPSAAAAEAKGDR